MAKTKTATIEKESKNTPTNTKGIFIDEIQITNANTAVISYRTLNDSYSQEITYKGQEEITEEFKNIFQQNVEGFIGVFPALAKDAKKITMNIIKFYYGKDSFLKNALYSVKYAFNQANNAVVNISTPSLPIWQEGFDEKTFCISGKYEVLLHETINKAKAYINGETRTKQLSCLEVVVDNTKE